MALIHKLFGKDKTLSDLSRQELRREEILVGKQRDRLFAKVQTLADQKQLIFKSGAQQKSPELRKALAQDFELKTQEQLLCARELGVRSKELLTISRLRMVKENQKRGQALGRLKVTDKDVATISNWIEDDSITQDDYIARLDSILELGSQTDTEALQSAGVSGAGKELLDIWSALDRGTMKQDQAFDQADQAVRRRTAEKTE
jgi:hypothetical protein